MSQFEDIHKIKEVLEKPEDAVQAPFSGTYKSRSGIFAGSIRGNVDLPRTAQPPIIPPTPPPVPPPLPPAEYEDTVSQLLAIQIQNQNIVVQNQNQIIENQLADRIERERNAPLINDNPCYDWEEEIIQSGFQVSFQLLVPEGQVFFLEYWNITYNDDSIYSHTIDGVGAATLPTITQSLQDFGDHNMFMRPPRLVYNSLVLTAANVSQAAQVYGVFIRGFFRDAAKLNPNYVGQR